MFSGKNVSISVKDARGSLDCHVGELIIGLRFDDIGKFYRYVSELMEFEAKLSDRISFDQADGPMTLTDTGNTMLRCDND